jgi:hypothetical protein
LTKVVVFEFLVVVWVCLGAITAGYGLRFVIPSLKKGFYYTENFIQLPDCILAEELGEIEGSLPGLLSVTVVAHRIEDPSDNVKLQQAVVKNLRKKIKYEFLISPSNAISERLGYYQIFKVYVEQSFPDMPTNNLVSISSLAQEWNDYPYVFYTIEAKGKHYTIAYRGTQSQEGIANEYQLVDKNNAQIILELAKQNATTVEEPADLTYSPIKKTLPQ